MGDQEISVFTFEEAKGDGDGTDADKAGTRGTREDSSASGRSVFHGTWRETSEGEMVVDPRWIRLYDETTGCEYYYDSEEKKVQWEPPPRGEFYIDSEVFEEEDLVLASRNISPKSKFGFSMSPIRRSRKGSITQSRRGSITAGKTRRFSRTVSSKQMEKFTKINKLARQLSMDELKHIHEKQRFEDGDTVIIRCVRRLDLAKISVMLSDPDLETDVNARDSLGDTALDIAIRLAARYKKRNRDDHAKVMEKIITKLRNHPKTLKSSPPRRCLNIPLQWVVCGVVGAGMMVILASKAKEA
mmetsp:Transcript_6844/g.12541  ORF Transcript_6844/g.12541 Transcript_6844/m.12541 type:complete len:300 (+) Transcript_6844:133-1032(+)|eukprot:CAMPEP_0197539658 /NCGR_PEP_ID=MMETSP1318-20131121/63394_1 /TAXON_ID=552666 /ORGANISM="Partenskyella glossopodia, Strain RCC365" /LENGTH=299 /DNA_ID=CAMNT_0043098425 /DNA_START=83 /DNA_END=982 /DNA_ORIENTATION=+